eukprot:gene7515-10237_t
MIGILLIIGFCIAYLVSASPPNIIFILLDDVGWNDIRYNNADSPIPTDFIDKLASHPQSVQLKQYYVQSLCTPTRAALLTGKYAANTGLNSVLVVGTPAGLPDDIPTLPQILKEIGYSTSMAGKWHLGNSQFKQTPIGRGFEEFVGIFMWDADSFTKRMYLEPWIPSAIDWIEQTSNVSFKHFAEPLHSTEAITLASERFIIKHSQNYGHEEKPLFLYVPFTAAHSPLQPIPRHEKQCEHISQIWRRQFCGMVVGLDEGIKNITQTAKTYLGDNTIIILSSDNGGSPWFGGINQPLRGTKSTPFEGGIRVPGLIVDLSFDGKYLGNGNANSNNHNNQNELKFGSRKLTSMMHVTDWLPTILNYANYDGKYNLQQFVENIDGFDFSETLRSVPFLHPNQTINQQNKENEIQTAGPRNEILLEMYYKEDSIFDEDLESYRYGDYKLIKGIIRDGHYYHEPLQNSNFLNIKSNEILNNTIYKLFQSLLHILELFFGAGPFDMMRISLTHKYFQDSIKSSQNPPQDYIRLYDIINDPLEITNIASLHPNIVKIIEEKLLIIKNNRPVQQKVWMQYDLDSIWTKTFVPGDCSANTYIKKKESCLFAHPWIADVSYYYS